MYNINIHNHTTYSDGIYAPEELIRFAYRRGLYLVGITDHFATVKARSVELNQLSNYIQHLKRLKIEMRSKIELLIGVEIDSSTSRTDFDKLNYSELNKLDFILVEYVNDPLWKGMPFPDFIKLRENFKIPVGLAHPDIQLCYLEIPHEKIIKELEDHDVFIELDTAIHNSRHGKPYYYHAKDFFGQLKDSEVALAIGSDTHEDGKDVVNIYDANQFIEELGLQKNVDLFLKKLNIKIK